MRRSLVLLLITLVIALWNCSPPKEKIPPVPAMKSPGNKLIIYQLLPRLFGNTVAVNKLYGTLAENGSGKFEDINESALRSLKSLGITHIWYTGVIEHAVLTDYTAYGIPLDDADVVKGRAGSPYAIKDYYDVNPDLAVDIPNRMLEFERLVDRTHQNGMKVLIDFVPNHVARSYHSDAKPEGTDDLGAKDDKTKAFDPNNNFYYIPGQPFQVPKGYNSLGNNSFPTKDGKFDENPAKATGNNVFSASPSVDDWFETVKLNYGINFQEHKNYFEPIPDTWLKMKDILVYWAGKKVDGFRCDMAEMVPVEFWHWVIPQIKAINPELIFVAEIYTPASYQTYMEKGRFDFLYDKVQLYDTLRLLINGKAQSTDIPQIQESLKTMNGYMVHFMENHDEQRIASPFFAGDPWKALPAMVVSATIDKGPVMIFAGQEVGEPAAGATGFKGDDGRTTHFDYWGEPELQKWVNAKKYDGGLLGDDQKQLRQFYGDLLVFCRENKAVAHGAYFDLTASNVSAGNCPSNVVVYARVDDDERLVIIAGFNEKQIRIRVGLSPEVVKAFRLSKGTAYIGRDLLRSGTDIGLNDEFIFETDLPPYSSLILKIK